MIGQGCGRLFSAVSVFFCSLFVRSAFHHREARMNSCLPTRLETERDEKEKKKGEAEVVVWCEESD